jgi:putative hydrolase of HD superfamily
MGLQNSLDFFTSYSYSESMVKRIVEFLFEAGMLKRTPRTGYQFLGSGRESVADHSFRTAIIGYVLASQEPHANRGKVILMCLFHDLPEARTGDHNYVNKRYVQFDEEKVVRDQVGELLFADEIIELTREFRSSDTLEARLSKDADQLDLILELKEQQDFGNPNTKDWLSFAVKRLLTENAKRMAKEILTTTSTNWWFDKKTDWWVNGPANQT